ncbi:MAG TPA: hypothetical protein VGP08_18010 [Pyrinomonadaceae bacterium]|nr:hypothetical protein [Pyrinomonadaceae bacterium]
MNASETSLVEGSREAIIKTGFSEAYFDQHFHLARVVDNTGDRRVVWRFSVGGHEATVSDSIGFYTEGGRRFDTHSVAGTLNTTNDLTRTITRTRAERIMRRCIGRFTNPQVEYRAHGPQGAAALLLTAEALVVPRGGSGREAREHREREERERREREERERAERQSTGSPQADVIEEEDEGGDGSIPLLGAVDLSNGKCTVGRGQSGPPVPPQPRRGVS